MPPGKKDDLRVHVTLSVHPTTRDALRDCKKYGYESMSKMADDAIADLVVNAQPLEGFDELFEKEHEDVGKE